MLNGQIDILMDEWIDELHIITDSYIFSYYILHQWYPVISDSTVTVTVTAITVSALIDTPTHTVYVDQIVVSYSNTFVICQQYELGTV